MACFGDEKYWLRNGIRCERRLGVEKQSALRFCYPRCVRRGHKLGLARREAPVSSFHFLLGLVSLVLFSRQMTNAMIEAARGAVHFVITAAAVDEGARSITRAPPFADHADCDVID